MTHIISRSLRLLLPLFALTLSSCFLLPREEEVLAPPLAEPPTITYRTEPVSKGDLEHSIRAFGTMVSSSQSDLYMERRGGRLKTVYVSVGDEVQAGDLIADLYTDSLESEIAMQELSLRRANLALRQARESAGDDFSLDFAEADRDLALLRLQRLQDELMREEELATVVGGDADRLRSLRQSIEEQEINVRKAELSVQRIAGQDTPMAVELAQLDLESATLRLETLEYELESTRLYAPIGGRITWVSRSAQEGDNIQAFQRIVRIADPTELVFQYQGRDADEFDVGMTCVVTLDDNDYFGEVILTEGSVPFDQREEYEDTVQVRLDSIPSDSRIGQTAVTRLVLARREDVLVLPKRAVQRYSTRRYVHVLVNGVRVERDIEVGLETATAVEIVSGLEEGEEVVMR